MSLPGWLSFLERGERHTAFRDCGDESVDSGREPIQMGWYSLASSLLEGGSVLDVGAGMGEGLRLLSENASEAHGIDVDDRLERSDGVVVDNRDVATVPSKSFDNVVCIDVVEHVEADEAFVRDLARVARKRVFISTPNYASGLNTWPYHVREYTPSELYRMLSPYGVLSVYGGDCTGEEWAPVSRLSTYHFLCNLYGYRGLHYVAKIARRLLGVRIWSHQAYLIDLDRHSAGA